MTPTSAILKEKHPPLLLRTDVDFEESITEKLSLANKRKA
jgi:hypothetical protein